MRLRDGLMAAMAAAFSLAVASLATAQVTGKVTLKGKAPKMSEIDMSQVKDCAALHPDPVNEDTVVGDGKGGLGNVVVSIKTDDPAAIGGDTAPKTAAVLDQKGCMYGPHVTAMMVGQELKVKNSDGFLHNIQSLAQINPGFNKAQQGKNDGEKVETPKAPEAIKVKCQVHPWMLAYIVVLNNSFFAVTKPDGSFTLPKGLPDGEYTVQFWHEKYGTTPKEKKVTVKGGNATVDFAFDAG